MSDARELTPKEREAFEREWEKDPISLSSFRKVKSAAEWGFATGLACTEQQTKLAVAGAYEAAVRRVQDGVRVQRDSELTFPGGKYTGVHAQQLVDPEMVYEAILALTPADAQAAFQTAVREAAKGLRETLAFALSCLRCKERWTALDDETAETAITVFDAQFPPASKPKKEPARASN